MRVRLTFKTPDVADSLEEDERDDPEVQKVIKKFVEFDEYVTVEFDSKTQTARVLEAD